MLASHAGPCLSTGSLEILVFHTLLAGNMGQFGAPGTTVVMTGPAVRDAVRPLTRTAPRVFSRALRCSLLVDAAAHPATNTATTAPAIMRRYPAGAGTVTSRGQRSARMVRKASCMSAAVEKR